MLLILIPSVIYNTVSYEHNQYPLNEFSRSGMKKKFQYIIVYLHIQYIV